MLHGGANANVNLANTRGETPLIFAVHNRDLPMARLLLANGGEPLSQADRIAGKSARDYAVDDPRAGAMVKLLDETGAQAQGRTSQGPHLLSSSSRSPASPGSSPPSSRREAVRAKRSVSVLRRAPAERPMRRAPEAVPHRNDQRR